MEVVDLIARRRDGCVQTRDEFEQLAQGAAQHTIADYQLSAWLMAAFFRPLTVGETTELTLAMARSGEVLDLTGLPKPWVDKHSTGGVGDKTTLVLLPLLASCGLTMVKMSGRGLGITGGTIDKLESIPGINLDLTPQQMKDQALKIGIALTGQTPRLAPADGVLYGLRDVTGTVASMPLVVSSILSKKLAGGAEVVSLDVKCGSGAFMPTFDRANELAQMLGEVGSRIGLSVYTHITDMDQPLGRAAGNALEVREAWMTLRGQPESPRFWELCVHLAASTLYEAGTARRLEDAKAMVLHSWETGAALKKAQEWIGSQKGDLSVFDTDDWQIAPVQKHVTWPGDDGWVTQVCARTVGEVVIQLGGGRRTKLDAIDPRVGIQTLVEVGDRLAQGQDIFVIHAATPDSAATATNTLSKAVAITPTEATARPVILGGTIG